MKGLRYLLGQRGLYYSDKCFKDNIRIYNEKKTPISESEYDNITEQKLSHYEIRTIINATTLNCGDVKFTLCNGEYFSVAFGLIQRSLKGALTITIFDPKHKKNVSPAETITNIIRYDLKIECQFPFKNLKGDVSYHKMNYFSTVNDAKQEIAFSIPNGLATPDEVTIYDENQQRINDPNRKLVSIPNFENVIFYSIGENSMYSKVLSDQNLTKMAKSCYKDSNPITNYLAKKRLFYSDKCLKSKLHLYVFGCEVKYEMFKSYKNVKESQIEIKDGGNIATINYNGMKFIFCDDETISVAIGLIHNTFKVSLEDVSIYDSNNRKLPVTTILKNQTKYKVEVKFRFRFKMIKMKGDNAQNMDYLSTINDAKLRLSMIYCASDVEKVVIYDDNKNEIQNPNLKLIDIPNFQKQIYCEIDTNRGEQSLYRTQKFKSKFNPQRNKDKRSSSPPAKEFSKSQYQNPHPNIEFPSFALSPLENSPPSPKPAQKIQIIRDEKPDKKVPEPEPEPEVVVSTRPSRRRVKIKGPTVTAIENEKSKQSPDKKVPIKEQSSSDDVASPNTHKDDDEDKNESNGELMINFVFSNDLEKKYYPFKKKLNPETTIKEICDMIKEKCKIEDQLKISYKYKNSFCDIDPTMNIDDVRDDIAEKLSNGKTENYLYIDIKKQTQRSKSDPVKKKDELIRKSKNSSSSDDGSASPSTKIKIPKKPIAHNSSQNTDDDEKSSPKRPTSASAILNSTSSSSDDEKSPKKQVKNTPENKKTPPKRQSSSSEEENNDNEDDEYGEPTEFTFKYGSTTKKIMLPIMSSLILSEADIKKKFKIKEDAKIDFYIGDEMIEDKDAVLEDLQGQLIRIEIRQKVKKPKSGVTYPYIYQTNRDENEHKVELDPSATVLTLKQAIAEEYEVDNLADIKIIFAGKDLLNKIVLKDLNIGDIMLYVYIRTTDDIILMTAKGLRY